VFPFLHLQAQLNGVDVTTLKKDFSHITVSMLKHFDLLLGSDISFWDSLHSPLKRLFERAIKAGVQRILLADPGRSPFMELCDYFVKKGIGEKLDWTTQKPRPISGYILKIDSEEKPLLLR